MTSIKQLKNLLTNEILQDLESAIDEIFAIIEKEKDISLALKKELEQMQEMHAECREILVEIEADEMTEDEATLLLEELVDIKTE